MVASVSGESECDGGVDENGDTKGKEDMLTANRGLPVGQSASVKMNPPTLLWLHQSSWIDLERVPSSSRQTAPERDRRSARDSASSHAECHQNPMNHRAQPRNETPREITEQGRPSTSASNRSPGPAPPPCAGGAGAMQLMQQQNGSITGAGRYNISQARDRASSSTGLLRHMKESVYLHIIY
ncbi:hypothetical protein AAFF_G00410760 [Aldrovandia affinis]|uniref:Uncharacterized protein n=1 Tax=Aldrovandia affinis TaxID=143900 RepID=A0AAD7R3V4_9TELE|nr:hypothetical protein AAFF_G00410760 [Aldrovandia affinis]